MEIEYIKAKIADENIEALIAKIKSLKPEIDEQATSLFDIAEHDVMQSSKRPLKTVSRTKYDIDGNPVLRGDGSKETITTYEEVCRIPLPVQKYIAEQRVNMLLSNPVQIDSSAKTEIEKNLIEVLNYSWKKNKTDYLLKELLLRQISECEVALIAYKEIDDTGYWTGTINEGKKERIRLSLLTSDNGASLYPVFNKYNDLVAFGRAYELVDDGTNNKIEYWDLYTAEKNYYYRNDTGVWSLEKDAVNIDNKIPIIYFYQKNVEWYDVQPGITRKETLISNHGDTNDYSGSPITLLSADTVESMPEKEDRGKTILLTGQNAKASYLESSGAPESLKLEYEHLTENNYMFSGTIDFNGLQSYFGSAPSGYAIKLLFQNAHMAASQKEADFGKGVIRLLNIMKSILCSINPDLKTAQNLNTEPVFTYYLPQNTVEDVTVLIAAYEAGIISLQTLMSKNPLVKNAAAEIELIKKEAEAKAKLIPPTPPANPAN